MKNIPKLFDFLTLRLADVAGFFLCVMALLVASDVFLKIFFSYGIPGSMEMTQLLIALMILLGISQAQVEKAHIRIDFVTNHLPVKTRKYLDVFSYAVAITFFAILLWESIEIFKESWEIKEYYPAMIRVPIYPARAALLLGFTLIIIQFIKDLISLFIKKNDNGG